MLLALLQLPLCPQFRLWPIFIRLMVLWTQHIALTVTKVLGGVRSLGAVPDVRLPVTLPVLSRLVHALPTLFSSRYKCLMLRAMMVLAFKVYLRICKMVPRSRSMVRGCLHVDGVLLSGDLITISFRRFKHSALQGPQSLYIHGACSLGSSIYVAAFLRDFLRARGAKQALLFALGWLTYAPEGI